jgi:hypothetical protein
MLFTVAEVVSAAKFGLFKAYFIGGKSVGLLIVTNLARMINYIHCNEMKEQTGLCVFSNSLRFLVAYFEVKYVDIFKILICFAVHIVIKA